MEKTFAVEYLIDGAPIQERDISEAFSDAYGSPCCVSVREVPSAGEVFEALEDFFKERNCIIQFYNRGVNYRDVDDSHDALYVLRELYLEMKTK